ncbi:MAG: hypothetical protein ABEJ77_00445 [Halanaeroarchaeum sp.]
MPHMTGTTLPAQIFGGLGIEHLEAWQIGVVAFAFVFAIVGVSYLLEKWSVGLHA